MDELPKCDSSEALVADEDMEQNVLGDYILTWVRKPIHQGVATIAAQWKVLLFGQILSFLIASQGATQSTLHLDCNLSAPAFATGLVYAVLALFLIPLLWKRRLKPTEDSLVKETWFSISKSSLRTYFFIALLDVEANYFTVMSFRYTSLTSASVLDAVAIPSAMLFSKLCLKRRYVGAHLLGVAVCLCGVITNVFTDFESEEDDDGESKEYPHLILGDFLAILGGFMFGARDVLTEQSVKNFGGTVEYLGMIGFFGTLVSFVQVLLLERNEVHEFFAGGPTDTCSKQMGLWLLMLYVVTTSVRYTGFAHFLVVSEAALLNLSLLTGDLWSAIFEVAAERIVPPPLFWVALVLVIGGVFIYEIGPSPIVEKESPDDEVEIIFVEESSPRIRDHDIT